MKKQSRGFPVNNLLLQYERAVSFSFSVRFTQQGVVMPKMLNPKLKIGLHKAVGDVTVAKFIFYIQSMHEGAV